MAPLLSADQHVGAGQHSECMQVRTLLCILDTGRAERGPNVGMVGQRLHHREDGAVLQERELASSEVVQQRTETFGAHGDLRVQSPGVVGIELATSAVQPLRGGAHGQ